MRNSFRFNGALFGVLATLLFAACSGSHGLQSSLPSIQSSAVGSAQRASTESTNVPNVSGTIAGVSGNVVNIQGGAGCGYVNVTYTGSTEIDYNGLTLTKGVYASVFATGSCGTSFSATRIVLSTSEETAAAALATPTPTPTPTPTAPPNISGTIYGVSGSTININGGAGCGYVNVTYSGSTQIVYNGFTLTSGVYLSAWATGSCGTSFSATKIVLGVAPTPTPSPTPTHSPTPTPAPTPTPTLPPPPPNLLSHIVTNDYCCGGSYQSDTPSGGIATAAPWINYWGLPSANSDPTGTYPSYGTPGLQNNGISPSTVYAYIDDSRIYSGSSAYNLIAPGGADASAVAQTCSGTPITVSNGTGYLTDPYQPATLAVYDNDISIEYNYSTEYGIIFLDDVDGYKYNDNSAVPCHLGAPWAQPGITSAYASLIGGITLSNLANGHAPPLFFLNVIGPIMGEAAGNAAAQSTDIAALATIPSVIGFECEGCLADLKNPEIGNHTAYEQTNEWVLVEDAAIATVNLNKMFLMQVQDASSTGAASYAGRTYVYASLMLTWNPAYTSYQNDYYGYVGNGTTPNRMTPQIHVYPEVNLTPYYPLVPYPSTSAGIGALQDSGGTYFREYQSCYYQGVSIGQCAFVVNPDSAAHNAPTLRQTYGHTMTILNSADVLDGGSISRTGTAMPASIPAVTGYVLLR